MAATKAVLDEIGRLKTEPPTPDELRKAKDQVLNSFIFNYDTREKTLNEQVSLAFYGYPPDFLEKYKDGIEKVTAADVTRVANKYIDASKLAILVVGNKSEIKPPLSTSARYTTSTSPFRRRPPERSRPPAVTLLLSRTHHPNVGSNQCGVMRR